MSLLYGIASSASYTSDFHDITSGSNFVATAKTGYDMVTGLGSPVASRLIAAAATASSTTTNVAKAAAVTTTTATTSTTHATPHAQVVLAAATTATAGTTSVAVSSRPAP